MAAAAAAAAAALLVVPPNLANLSDALAALRPVVAANHHADVRNDLLLTSLDGAVMSKELLQTFADVEAFQVGNDLPVMADPAKKGPRNSSWSRCSLISLPSSLVWIGLGTWRKLRVNACGRHV